MKDISLFLAFAAGLLSFLSPCVLPLVPAYISYLTGETVDEIESTKSRVTVVYKSVGFVLGFSIIFIIMGVSITSLGKLFDTNRDIFRKVSGILIIIFGIHTMGIYKIKLLYREKRFLSFNKAHRRLFFYINWNGLCSRLDSLHRTNIIFNSPICLQYGYYQ